MYIVLLKFADHKSKAPQLMEKHTEWIKQGFMDGVFLLTGSLQPQLGGVIIANSESRDELIKRILKDPFVAEGVVIPEVLEIKPGQAVHNLEFLIEK